ncbi:putative guanyl-specific ribonuclease f1 [Golovinomyces cichoracearum]|uniref:Putative guanyl-specific ribonuclease f1 n=1 Tax=Golovinomyces cichoracearum TaxID=62708 RepID=A0A420J814_9PEZI|nr:putative guanyl-specific ribonuclease f1 [Golovinomyces cichoracearum]
MNAVITGFQCGLEEIKNELLLLKLVFTARWRNSRRDRYDLFPERIPGLEGPNLMWLLADKDDPNSGEEREARIPIYLITDKFGSFVQVSFMLLNGKHARCNVKTKPTDFFPTLWTNHPRTSQMGYICDVFFDDNYLSRCANDARKQRKKASSVYPKFEYLGPKIGNVLISRLQHPRSSDQQVRHSRYFLAMSKDFQVLRVLRYFKHKGYKNCLRQGIERDQEPEESDFICDEKKVANEDLRRVAETACQSISMNTVFPKIYRGPRFDLVGPYLISQQITELSS